MRRGREGRRPPAGRYAVGWQTDRSRAAVSRRPGGVDGGAPVCSDVAGPGARLGGCGACQGSRDGDHVRFSLSMDL